MKISKMILAIWLATSAWAQSPPPKPQAEPHSVAKPSGGSAASASPKAPAPAKAKPANKTAGESTPSSSRRHGRSRETARPSATHDKVAVNGKPAHKGGRDPFVSPIVERARVGENCTGSGRKCLFVEDITLQGVVRYTNGYIAVVMSGEHTYFLHERDPLADGDVERISSDAITLRQRSSDVLGRPVEHEVTRKLGVPSA